MFNHLSIIDTLIILKEERWLNFFFSANNNKTDVFYIPVSRPLLSLLNLYKGFLKRQRGKSLVRVQLVDAIRCYNLSRSLDSRLQNTSPTEGTIHPLDPV